MSQQQQETIERLRQMSNQAQFVSFTYLSKGKAEKSRYVIIFGASYRKQLEDSILALELLEPTLVLPIQKLALTELKDSFKLSLESLERGEFNPNYTKPHAYITLSGGLKFSLNNGTINASGLEHTKKIIEAGVVKLVKHSPLTAAKIELRSTLPIGRWREFVIAPENLQSVRLQGVELVLND